VSEERWIVGAEYDVGLFDRLGAILRSLGYQLDSKSYGIGGSQEISQWIASGPKGKLIIETETFIGLSISGPNGLVNEIRECLN
jgi:hypothetical protein